MAKPESKSKPRWKLISHEDTPNAEGYYNGVEWVYEKGRTQVRIHFNTFLIPSTRVWKQVSPTRGFISVFEGSNEEAQQFLRKNLRLHWRLT